MTIPELYKLFLKYPNITTDSREITENSIFWALRGENFNGNKFAESALNSGAIYAIIDDRDYRKSDRTILVNNSLETLQQLANYHRKKLNIPILALTGTNGKTTTKELINSVLSTQYKVKATQGNFNNHIGVPLTILSLNKTTEIGIIEMGANHPGEINILCEIAEPDFGLITNIGKAHLEGFGSFEGVTETKAELYKHILKNKGTIFFNSDNPLLNDLDKGNKTVSYGRNPDTYLKGKIISSNPFLSVEIETYEGIKTEINSKLIGTYNFENILAAACTGDFFNISVQNIKKAIEKYTPSNNRSQIIKTKNNTIILDAYNANPSSMQLSAENFVNLNYQNKILILGDMYELGKYSEEEHKKVIISASEYLKKHSDIKAIFFVGKYFKNASDNIKTNSEIKYFKSTEEIETYIQNKTYNNYTFFIKGSRAVKLETLINYIS